jgi:hypothetical protein
LLLPMTSLDNRAAKNTKKVKQQYLTD